MKQNWDTHILRFLGILKAHVFTNNERLYFFNMKNNLSEFFLGKILRNFPFS